MPGSGLVQVTVPQGRARFHWHPSARQFASSHALVTQSTTQRRPVAARHGGATCATKRAALSATRPAAVTCMWLLGVVTVDRLAVHTVQPASASTAGSTFNFKVPGQIIAIKAVPIPQQLAQQKLAQMLNGTGIQGIQPSGCCRRWRCRSTGSRSVSRRMCSGNAAKSAAAAGALLCAASVEDCSGNGGRRQPAQSPQADSLTLKFKFLPVCAAD